MLTSSPAVLTADVDAVLSVRRSQEFHMIWDDQSFTTISIVQKVFAIFYYIQVSSRQRASETGRRCGVRSHVAPAARPHV